MTKINKFLEKVFEDRYKNCNNQQYVDITQRDRIHEGFYLKVKQVHKFDKDKFKLLCINAEKKAVNVYRSDNDEENARGQAKLLIIKTFHNLINKKYNGLLLENNLNAVNNIHDLEQLLNNPTSAAKLSALVVGIVETLAREDVKQNGTRSTQCKKVNFTDQSGNKKQSWLYDSYEIDSFDKAIEESDTELLESLLLHVVEQDENSNYNNIYSYICKHLDLLTPLQISFLNKYLDIDCSDYAELLKNRDDDLYSKSSKQQFKNSIIKRFEDKLLKNNEFIKEINLNNLITYQLIKNDVYINILEDILNSSTLSDKFNKLIKYLKSNQYDFLEDFIYSLDVTLYKPLVSYMSTGVTDRKYLNTKFKKLIEALEFELEHLN